MNVRKEIRLKDPRVCVEVKEQFCENRHTRWANWILDKPCILPEEGRTTYERHYNEHAFDDFY